MESDRKLSNLLSPAETSALKKFLEDAHRLLGDDLLEARFYGSKARGEGTEESDLDVALVVTAAGRARRYEVYDLAFDISVAHGVDLAPLVIEEGRMKQLRAAERRIAADLDREGIRL